MTDTDKELSKFLSFVLRHQPEAIGLTLDAGGWADVADLIKQAGRHGRALTPERIAHVVATSDKQRFRLSDDGLRIRANQGHSTAVDLGLDPTPPPAVLYHGTADHNITAIFASGLHSGQRQHVHLSPDVATAHKVGMRHGRPVILRVDCAAMAAAGHLFYISDNCVWLTDHVAAEYLTIQAPTSDGKEAPA